ALQAIADEELAELLAARAPSAAGILILDPKTGAILAMSDYTAGGGALSPAAPTHDTGDYLLGRSGSPGSAIQPLLAAAALEEGAITAEERFSTAGGALTLAGVVVHDPTVYDSLDAAGVLAVSSNVGAVKIYQALGEEALCRWVKRFHFGEAPALP